MNPEQIQEQLAVRVQDAKTKPSITISIGHRAMGTEQARAARWMEEAIRAAIDTSLGNAILGQMSLRVKVVIEPFDG